MTATPPCARRGTHGFVQLALDTRTSTRMAIKFIPRDQKMQTKSVLRCTLARAALRNGAVHLCASGRRLLSWLPSLSAFGLQQHVLQQHITWGAAVLRLM